MQRKTASTMWIAKARQPSRPTENLEKVEHVLCSKENTGGSTQTGKDQKVPLLKIILGS